MKVWREEDGVLCRSLTGHAHWINTLALNVDYVLRTGGFEPENGCRRPQSDEEVRAFPYFAYISCVNLARS